MARPATSDEVTDAWEPGWIIGLNGTSRRDSLLLLVVCVYCVLPIEVLKYTHRVVGPFPSHLMVADVMSRDVARVSPATPIHEVVTLLIDRALRSVPVVDD
jgi:CBS domain-containing protein